MLVFQLAAVAFLVVMGWGVCILGASIVGMFIGAAVAGVLALVGVVVGGLAVSYVATIVIGAVCYLVAIPLTAFWIAEVSS